MSTMDDMTVTVPEGELDGMKVARFTIEPNDLSNTLEGLKTGRSTRPGTYTKLTGDGHFWMSDTDAEKRDHLPAAYAMQRPGVRRVLINGLGLGMVLQAAMKNTDTETIDVVETDKRVIELVGPHYTTDKRVKIHHADAYEQAKAWPRGSYWDAAWHDIWPDVCEDNRADMSKLLRSYGRRTGWQACWGKDIMDEQKRRDARRGYGGWW
jgi:hypothetical protein